MRAVEAVLALVVIATLVATFARPIGVRAPSMVLVAEATVALIPGRPTIAVTPQVVRLVVVPPLLYAAGEELPWHRLKLVWRPVAVLACGLVIASAAVIAARAGELSRLLFDGRIGDVTFHHLQRQLDLERARLDA